MSKATKQQNKETKQQQTMSATQYFLNIVQSNGYSVKKYNGISEQSVQINGKIKFYFVPMKGGSLKLCLPINTDSLVIPENILKSTPIGKNGEFTYPSNYPIRFKIHSLDKGTQEFINIVCEMFIPQLKK